MRTQKSIGIALTILLVGLTVLSACGDSVDIRDVEIPDVVINSNDDNSNGQTDTTNPDNSSDAVDKNTDSTNPDNDTQTDNTSGSSTDVIDSSDDYAVTDSMVEPAFPEATPATNWMMFRRTPDNMALVDADIKTPFGKTFEGDNPDYRLVSFTAPAANYIYGSPAVDGDDIYFGVKLGYLLRYNFKNQAYIWRMEEPLDGDITTSIALDDTSVYFGTGGDGKMYAYDRITDSKIWEFQTGKNISAPPGAVEEAVSNPVILSHPKLYEGKIYFGAFDGKMYCLDAKTGKKVWEFFTSAKVYSSPAIAYDRLYFGNHDGKFYCLDANTGKLLWDTKLPKGITASPVTFGPRVWIGCKNSKMYCLKAFDGSILWEYQAPDSDYGIEACPAVDEQNIYFGDASGHFTCLDRKTGKRVWQVALSDKPLSSSPVIAGEKIFFGGHDMNIYAIRKSNGEVLDKFKTEGSVLASPIIVGNEVLTASYDSIIYFLRGEGTGHPYKR
ncbi:MAG TPA: PQQ-binding-like beta-propeller repeat protein [Caldisericia bacterium]|nr:PQQ-binding-like beta-propeller repeat protein [Caldisericia bacterium]HPF49569.1 PQQ-binding-like beta-propeller repeat protein [Caldisericia bacterium]HPI84515.1 PQQ-binding-like beta-propeller repeat protein [Caldisericia bacterium]HPQ93881.1 PQQ-binding-like beta-propeller repeat protein [Caldisericia bacterium]HRV75426.1 PQQ-binding-like beta-propeller repeat protein [Caldisericia bacterium]